MLRKGGTAIIFFDLWKITPLREMLEQAGFKSIRMIQWVKTNPVPLNSKRCYLSNAIEIALVAVKCGNGTFDSEYDNGILSAPICRDRGRFHPTQKPVDLMATLIRKHSRPGDLVVDPFAGSGTTGVAALREGRCFAGCEPDPEYFPKALARIVEADRPGALADLRHTAGQRLRSNGGPKPDAIAARRRASAVAIESEPVVVGPCECEGVQQEAAPAPLPSAGSQAPLLSFSARVLPCPLVSRVSVVSRPKGATDEPR